MNTKRLPVAVYDNGGKTADRYTVVYTKSYISCGKRYWADVCMGPTPFHPQGVCMHGEEDHRIDKPRHRHLGKRIKFEDLPTDCQKVVLRDLDPPKEDDSQAQETRKPWECY